jgi:hypothetical protein
MRLMPRILVIVVAGLAGTSLVAAASVESTTSTSPAKPVIGKPSATPKQPVAGNRFTVSFAVTRSDTGAPLTRGRMLCDPSVGGRVLRHAESFAGGRARLALVVPADAAGKLLKVKVTIRAGRSATRVAGFHVMAPAAPALSVGDSTVMEGNAGTTTLSLPVTLSTASARTVSVGYATANGTAVAPSDYAAASGTLTFPPGETAKTIAVAVVGDTAVEPNETLTVALSSPVEAVLGRSVATGTITNDDTAVPVTPGEYKGATQIGNYVFFSVLPSRALARFRVNDLPLRCGGVRLSGGEDLGESTYPINKNGRFSGTTSWTGSVVEGDVEWTRRFTRLTGVFGSATSATGTISVTTEMNYKGRHYTCYSGGVGWSATLQG